jgi:hypothetical protein
MFATELPTLPARKVVAAEAPLQKGMSLPTAGLACGRARLA